MTHKRSGEANRPPCGVVHLPWAILCSRPPQPPRKSPELMVRPKNCLCCFLVMVGISVGDNIHTGSWKIFAAVTVAEICQL